MYIKIPEIYFRRMYHGAIILPTRVFYHLLGCFLNYSARYRSTKYCGR